MAQKDESHCFRPLVRVIISQLDMPKICNESDAKVKAFENFTAYLRTDKAWTYVTLGLFEELFVHV